MSMQTTLDFLGELARNNNRDWFNAHRGAYQAARSAFEDVVADLIAALSPHEDLGTLTAKECLFRINRDVRFAKDKSPYKTQMAAAIGRGGRHGNGRSYYLSVAPGDSFIGGGLYDADRTALANIRQHIADDDRPLRAVISADAFIEQFGTLRGDALKLAPAGYDRDHPAIDLLRYKQFLAIHQLGDGEVVRRDLPQKFVAAALAMRPLLDYLEMAASTSL